MMIFAAAFVAYCTVSQHEIRNCDLTQCTDVQLFTDNIDIDLVRKCAKDLPDAGSSRSETRLPSRRD